MNPIYANNKFIGRTLSRLITPPHTALSVKNHICKIEGFNARTGSTLMESFSNTEAIEASTRVMLKGDTSPGLSEDDPMILVFESSENKNLWRNSMLPKDALPDSIPYEPRYLYYRIYNEGGAIATKTSFDTDDEFLGRVDTLSVTPPHTVASVGSRIAYMEGVPESKVQLFKETDGDALMNDDDQLSLLAQTYPGWAEEDPIAVVCEDAPKVAEDLSAVVFGWN